MRDYNKLKQEKNLNNNRDKIKKITKLIDFANRKSDAFTNQKVKSLIDFDEQYSCSIRSIAIKKLTKLI